MSLTETMVKSLKIALASVRTNEEPQNFVLKMKILSSNQVRRYSLPKATRFQVHCWRCSGSAEVCASFPWSSKHWWPVDKGKRIYRAGLWKKRTRRHLSVAFKFFWTDVSIWVFESVWGGEGERASICASELFKIYFSSSWNLSWLDFKKKSGQSCQY